MNTYQKIVAAAVTGGLSAILAAALIVGNSAGADVPRVDNSLAPHEFPTNAYGDSYGSALDATSPDNEPDLIAAYGVDGTLGYVRATDLNGRQPANPREAAAMVPAAKLRIPLYAEDGRTVLGEFELATTGIGQSEAP